MSSINKTLTDRLSTQIELYLGPSYYRRFNFRASTIRGLSRDLALSKNKAQVIKEESQLLKHLINDSKFTDRHTTLDYGGFLADTYLDADFWGSTLS